MVLGLALAMLLDRPLRGRNLVRPTVYAVRDLRCRCRPGCPAWPSRPHFGLIQDLLRRIGVGKPDFYQDARWALFMVTVTYKLEEPLGHTFVIYLVKCWWVRRSGARKTNQDSLVPSCSL